MYSSTIFPSGKILCEAFIIVLHAVSISLYAPSPTAAIIAAPNAGPSREFTVSVSRPNTFAIISLQRGFLAPYPENIIGVGISLSGIVDSQNKILKIGTNFNLYEKSLKTIENAVGYPIYLINEANAGAIGEFFLNRTFDEQNIAFISIDSGIGAGIVIEGNLYTGHSSKAGEIGHFTVENHGKKCNCGNEGCLEMYCSNRALVKTFEQEFNISNLSFIEIFSKHLVDTEKGREILRQYTDYLASGIRGLLFMLDLDKVIIGGLISNYCDYIKEDLENKVFNNIFLKDKTVLEFSKYSDYSNLIGAAFLPFNDLFIHLL